MNTKTSINSTDCDVNIEDVEYIAKYTTLPFLLDILKTKKLSLLKPDSWDDKNDAIALLKYLDYKRIENNNIKSIFASCFTYDIDCIHHWNTFAKGAAGCVLVLNAKRFFKSVKEFDNDIRFDVVRYKKIKSLEEDRINPENIPFLKRFPYQCEKEIRLLKLSESKKKSYPIPINLNIIKKIKFSQSLPKSIYKQIRRLVKDFLDNEDIDIYHSTIEENKEWLNTIDAKLGHPQKEK